MDCATVPSLVSEFVDTFVDFSVSGGLFLTPEPESAKNSTGSLRTVFPQPGRLVAVGDSHGDLPKAKSALRLAGLIGPDDRWTGGAATVVQVGDIFDRGGDEIKLLYFFERLRREAAKAGGTVITMNGNHEIMNVDSDFRFVTRPGVEEFENWGFWQRVGNGMKRMCDGVGSDRVFRDLFDGVPDEIPGIAPEFLNGMRARIAALRPKGLIASRFLAKNQTVVVVGDSVFAHGGLLEKHVVYGLERLNEEVRDWLRGSRENVENQLVRRGDSIVWLRSFSNKLVKDVDCALLQHVLETIPGARRMIMGHTIQENGITSACGGRAIRVDVGMSRQCGDRFPEVLEIDEKSTLKVLTSNPRYLKRQFKASARANQKDGLGSSIPDQRSSQVELIMEPSKASKIPEKCWTKKEEEMLITCLKELVASGWRKDNGFKVGYLKVLEQNMAKVFPGTDLQATPYLRSKIHFWKRICEAMSSFVGHNGVGWNDRKKRIDGTKDFWRAVKKVNKKAYNIRHKSWPYYHDWCEIFGKDRATGEQVEDAMDVVNELADKSGNHEKVTLDIRGNCDDEMKSEDSTCKLVDDSIDKRLSGNKRKSMEGNGGLYELLDSFCRSTRARLGDIDCQIDYEDTSATREDVLEAAAKFGGLTLQENSLVSKTLVKST